MSRWAEFGFPEIVGYDRQTLLLGLQLALAERYLAVGMTPLDDIDMMNATLTPAVGTNIHMTLVQFENTLWRLVYYAGQKYPELCVAANGQLITPSGNTSGIDLGSVVKNQLKEPYADMAWSKEYFLQRYKIINLMRYKEFFNFKCWLKNGNGDWWSGNVNGYLKNYHEDTESGFGNIYRQYAVADADALPPVWLSYTFWDWSYYDFAPPPNFPPGNRYVFGDQLGDPNYTPPEGAGYAIQFRLCRDIRAQLEFYDEVYGDVLQY